MNTYKFDAKVFITADVTAPDEDTARQLMRTFVDGLEADQHYEAGFTSELPKGQQVTNSGLDCDLGEIELMEK